MASYDHPHTEVIWDKEEDFSIANRFILYKSVFKHRHHFSDIHFAGNNVIGKHVPKFILLRLTELQLLLEFILYGILIWAAVSLLAWTMGSTKRIRIPADAVGFFLSLFVFGRFIKNNSCHVLEKCLLKWAILFSNFTRSTSSWRCRRSWLSAIPDLCGHYQFFPFSKNPVPAPLLMHTR